jgi:hypothetical protein
MFQLLAPPPLNTHITDNEKVSIPYRKYFSNLNTALTATLLPTPFVSHVTGEQTNGMTVQLPAYTTTEINTMNPPDGVMVYDSTVLAAKIRIGGLWKEITVL